MFGKGIIMSLWVTLKHIFRPKVTLRYPKQKQPMSPRFFALIRLLRDKNGKEKCTGCGICALNCPTRAIAFAKGKREDGSQYALEYSINIQQCMFCGICVEVCPFGALAVGHKYELACYTREQMVYKKEELLASTVGA